MNYNGHEITIGLYCDELKIAVCCYNEWHYKYDVAIYGCEEVFTRQKLADRMRKEMCFFEGIHLVIVPYTVPVDGVREYLIQRLPVR